MLERATEFLDGEHHAGQRRIERGGNSSGATGKHEARGVMVIAEAEAQLAGSGRLVIRPSGTEPVIRVMAEGDDSAQVEQVVDAICAAVKDAA